MKNQKPLIRKTLFQGNKLVYLYGIHQVKKFGNTGHITLPKELIGKRVLVEFNELKPKKRGAKI